MRVARRRQLAARRAERKPPRESENPRGVVDRRVAACPVDERKETRGPRGRHDADARLELDEINDIPCHRRREPPHAALARQRFRAASRSRRGARPDGLRRIILVVEPASLKPDITAHEAPRPTALAAHATASAPCARRSPKPGRRAGPVQAVQRADASSLSIPRLRGLHARGHRASCGASTRRRTRASPGSGAGGRLRRGVPSPHRPPPADRVARC